jgi:hypothetical protein
MTQADDIAEIKADLRTIRELAAETKAGIAVINERCSNRGEELDGIQHHLHGNGKNGLLADVNNLKGKMSVLWKLIWPALLAGGGGFGLGAGLF